ncbi:MAG: helix-turn-helix domain-containing protein [FCB group bacterium]|jgi:AraC-like DNA-binding protein|nr:helix-turn-helix domain-containing protein [FCB group bacterium]
MKPAAFFRLPEVQASLVRAARAAGTPLSIHYVDRGEEGIRVTGFGGCDACKHVAQMPDGATRCRESRVKTSVPALRRGRPVPYICHMGFACVSMPALPGSGLGFTLTFGPYCPAEAPETLEQDALWGFTDLGHNPEDGLPVSLGDIRFASAESVPAVAEWTSEALSSLWKKAQADEEPAPEEPAPPPPKPAHRARAKHTHTSPYDSAHIAASLAGGDGTRARKLIAAVLTESEGAARVKIAVRRARAAALVSAVLEAALRAQLNVERCWEAMPGFIAKVQEARTNEEVLAAVMDVLCIIRRRHQRSGEDGDGLVALNRIVMARLADGITLNEVARELGQHPTAITHRLQRKFGMSFTQYIGQLRVSMAKDLLRFTRLSTGEISLRVGIRDGSNLGKLFRKFEGMSPQEYRRRFGKKE